MTNLSNEADYVLRTVEERGIRFIRLWFTDVLGLLKSFAITPQELEGAFDRGHGLRRLVDRGLQPDPGVGHGRASPTRPRSRSSRGRPRRPWPACSATSHEPDGTPFDGDPRRS